MTGTVYVEFGGITGIASSRVLTGRSTHDPYEQYFGLSVSSIGDFDGDGFGDLAVGVNTVTGVTGYLYFGDPMASLAAPIAVHGQGIGPITGVGDLDRDGLADLAIGSPGALNGATVSIYFGTAQRDLVDIALSGSEAGFGTSVAPAGDINGDGFADFVVGADTRYQDSIGGAFLYLGGPRSTFNAVAADSILGAAGQFGLWNVAPAGDVNADGVDDVVIGGVTAPDSQFQGLVYVYQGQAINVFQEVPYGTLTDRTISPNGDYGVVVAQ
jgi:hypothetical protein